MPVVKLRYSELVDLLGRKVPRETLLDTIPMLGADLERVEGDEWGVEFFPNRPDLYSPPGVARALRAYLGLRPGLVRYPVGSSRWRVDVAPSVRKVRPVLVGALVDGVRMDDRRIQSLMDLQEDLHWGLGARRRKVSIGVHDRAALSPPLAYEAVPPDSVSFVPLQGEKEMTLREILAEHPKGRAYAHLLAGSPRYPLLRDAKGQVLSFPPIINGTLTTVTGTTRDLFVDVTGTDEIACRRALAIVAAHFAEDGAKLRAVTIRAGARRVRTPDLSPSRRTLDPARARALLGFDLSPRDMAACLARMGHRASFSRGRLRVESPAWRTDLLHEVDLVEDVAIGHGYREVPETAPRSVTFGAPLASERVGEAAREAMLGLGYSEVMTLSLTSDRESHEALHVLRSRVTLANPITEDHTIVRTSLLPSLLSILRANVRRDLPQQIFEVGDVVTPVPKGPPENRRMLAAVRIAPRASFTEAKSLAQALLRDLALPWQIRATEHGAFVEGRCGGLFRDDEPWGVFGEIHPRTVEAFGLGNPVIALELRLPLRPLAEGPA